MCCSENTASAVIHCLPTGSGSHMTKFLSTSRKREKKQQQGVRSHKHHHKTNHTRPQTVPSLHSREHPPEGVSAEVEDQLRYHNVLQPHYDIMQTIRPLHCYKDDVLYGQKDQSCATSRSISQLHHSRRRGRANDKVSSSSSRV